MGLQCGLSTIVVTDANRFRNFKDKNLAVTDLARARRGGESPDNFVRTAVGHNHFEFDLRKKVYVVFLTSIDLLVTFLPPMTANFADGHAVYAGCLERLFHFFQLERLDNRFDFFHTVFLASARSRLEYVSFLAVQSDVQALNFLVLVHTQPDERIADLENNQRADDRETPGDRTTDYLIEHLPAITIHQAKRQRLAGGVFQSIFDR